MRHIPGPVAVRVSQEDLGDRQGPVQDEMEVRVLPGDVSRAIFPPRELEIGRGHGHPKFAERGVVTEVGEHPDPCVAERLEFACDFILRGVHERSIPLDEPIRRHAGS